MTSVQIISLFFGWRYRVLGIKGQKTTRLGVEHIASHNISLVVNTAELSAVCVIVVEDP